MRVFGIDLVAPASEVATLQAYITANHPRPSSTRAVILRDHRPAVAPIHPSVRRLRKVLSHLTTGAKFDENLTGVTLSLGDRSLAGKEGLPWSKSGSNHAYILHPWVGNRPVGSIANRTWYFIFSLSWTYNNQNFFREPGSHFSVFYMSTIGVGPSSSLRKGPCGAAVHRLTQRRTRWERSGNCG